MASLAEFAESGRGKPIHSEGRPPPPIYGPRRFGHGLITLADDTEALYLVDEFYSPEHERGVRWDDPRFAIPWPAQLVVMSEKDRNYPDFDPAWHLSAEPKGRP